MSAAPANHDPSVRELIRGEVEHIRPFDALERAHRLEVLDWIDSGVELCRRHKPATPPKHLVSYIVVTNGSHLLLVDHKNAQLWLPAGGHVEPGEHPRTTAARELKEELGLEIVHPMGAPRFLTCAETVGPGSGHTDVSLWYVVNLEVGQPLKFDGNEFESVRWFKFADIPHGRTDPHLPRFLKKFTAGDVGSQL